jgi:hypothetical protein
VGTWACQDVKDVDSNVLKYVDLSRALSVINVNLS